MTCRLCTAGGAEKGRGRGRRGIAQLMRVRGSVVLEGALLGHIRQAHGRWRRGRCLLHRDGPQPQVLEALACGQGACRGPVQCLPGPHAGHIDADGHTKHKSCCCMRARYLAAGHLSDAAQAARWPNYYCRTLYMGGGASPCTHAESPISKIEACRSRRCAREAAVCRLTLPICGIIPLLQMRSPQQATEVGVFLM